MRTRAGAQVTAMTDEMFGENLHTNRDEKAEGKVGTL